MLNLPVARTHIITFVGMAIIALTTFPIGAQTPHQNPSADVGRESEGAIEEQNYIKELKQVIAGRWIIKVTPIESTTGEMRAIIPDGSMVAVNQRGPDVSMQCRLLNWDMGWGYLNWGLYGTYSEGVLLMSNQSASHTLKADLRPDGTLAGMLTCRDGNLNNHVKMIRIKEDLNPRAFQNPKKINPTSDCFIATAAYGSPCERHVLKLRRFRDTHLLDNTPGRWFVRTYCRLSPSLAQAIAQRSWARWCTRVALKPVVVIVGLTMGDPGDVTLVCSIVLFFAAVIYVRRVKRIRKANAASLP